MEMENSCPHGLAAGKPIKIDLPHVHTAESGDGEIKEKMKRWALEFRMRLIACFIMADLFVSTL